MGVDRATLIGLALRAIEEAGQSAQPTLPNAGLRLALAFLFTVADGSRWPFDQFWRAYRQGGDDRYGREAREQTMNAAINAIYRAVKIHRPRAEHKEGAGSERPRPLSGG